jgi:teichuronic acid biosynthesis glycosyltransferase TuaC
LRVLVLTPVYPSPRSVSEGVFNEQHALALVAAGVSVTVVVCKPWLPSFIARHWPRYHSIARLPKREQRGDITILYARYLHIPGYRWPGVTVRSCSKAVLHAIQDLPDRRWDIIQCHSEWPVGLAIPWIKATLKIPAVITMHIQLDPPLFRQRAGAQLLQRMVAESDALVSVGTPLVRDAKQNWLPANANGSIRLIPNGVPLPDTPAEMRQRNVEARLNLISIGNLVSIKGIDYTLRALAALKDEGLSHWEYTVVGDGPARKDLEKLGAKLSIASQVTFTGRLTHAEAMRVLAQSDLFILPSWQEAFGVVYLEAMALGIPAIGCKGQGAEDIIRPGIDGLLVEPESVQSVVDALRSVLNHPEELATWGAQARRRATEFSWDRNVRAYLSLYGELMAAHAKQHDNLALSAKLS